MKGFILKSHEAQALDAGKPVVIWRVLKEQPPARYTEQYYEKGWLSSKSTSGQGAEQQDLWNWPTPPFPTREIVHGVTIKPISFGDGKYGAGDDGHIYDVSGDVPVLRPAITTKKGYQEIGLRHAGTKKTFRVSRLIIEAFYRTMTSNEVSRHLNRIRNDNRPENLDVGSCRQNTHDAMFQGSFKGRDEKLKKLQDSCIEEIKSSPEPQQVLADRYGVHQSTISRIQHGKRRKGDYAIMVEVLPRYDSRIILTLSNVKVRRPCDVTEEEAEIMLPDKWCPYSGDCQYGFVPSGNTSLEPVECKCGNYTLPEIFQEWFKSIKGDVNLCHFTALATPQP